MKPTWISSTADAPWRREKLSPSSKKARATLSLDGSTHQTWQGFGGCFNELGWTALSHLDKSRRDGLLHDLFDPQAGCAFNYCRMPIGANDYAESWYSHNEHDGDLAMKHYSIERDRTNLIPYIKAAQKIQPDMTLFASPWSPPSWMKLPKAYNYGTLVWEPPTLRAYALYLAKFAQAYAQEGIDINAIHVQNEPNSDQKFPSCLWTGPKMRDFIRDYMGPVFAKQGIRSEIWAGTIERPWYDAWANTILSDDKARRYVKGIGYQWAGKEAVQKTTMAWPEVPVVQTENECGDGRNTWEYAEHVGSLLHHYISNGVVAYVYWNMVLAPGGRSTWGWNQNAMITVDPVTRTATHNPEFYVMKHYAHFIAPGAQRLGVAGELAGNSVAFVNSNGSRVLVVSNPLDTPRTMTLDAGSGGISVVLKPHSVNTVVV